MSMSETSQIIQLKKKKKKPKEVNVSWNLQSANLQLSSGKLHLMEVF